MTNSIAVLAFYNVLFRAFSSFVSNLVAFETKFFCALERVMSILATKNTI
eukprot:CAMPEP_0176403298 /NCGR_PEP_ID=MMETSP0126-20121128/49986_1 /TAXON_ID=141414 ORGANISM="Strombidinopsis acuminatum, Strain SPMC142" /NCGR_SAMPLE_ID=MMETSP0126 /ASSEMBLY_ACC=CAM_ASM_000229 /LENGTH=49 /DNA_ID=CAMNT_0017781471 /DNA_START=1644 /DNA_END=1793 /DNA_ORIENTATION=-